MDIHRNAMGHRFYTKKDIDLLTKVRNLKEKGLQLKAIRNYIDMRSEQMTEGENKVIPISDNLVPVKQQILSNEAKMEQFQQLMNQIVSNAIQENNELIGKSAGEHAAQAVVGQISGMTKEQEVRAEERYRKLDQTLREIQKARQEAAAAHIRPVDKRRQARLNRKSKSANKMQDMVAVAGVMVDETNKE